MTQVCSVYSQLLQLFSRGQFAQAVNQHQADCNAKGLSSWEQFVAMLFCQMAHLNSLREACLGLASCESPLKHPGISITQKKSTSRMTTPTVRGNSTCWSLCSCWKSVRRRRQRAAAWSRSRRLPAFCGPMRVC